MADICGPYTLEQLDLFNNLDDLAFSLDSAIWTSADTCIFEGAASVSASATTSAEAIRIRLSAASVTATATAIGLGERLGENWTDEPEGSNTWTDIPTGSNNWIPAAQGTNTWLRNG